MFKVDEEKCVHCGQCMKDCSANALEFDDKKIPVIDEKKCFKCQHCLAVCPKGAVSVCGKNPENSRKICRHDSENLLNLIQSRLHDAFWRTRYQIFKDCSAGRN